MNGILWHFIRIKTGATGPEAPKHLMGAVEDEGALFSRGSAAPGRGSSRFPGVRQEEGRFGGQRSGPRPQGGRPGEPRPGDPRPGQARGFAPRGQGPRPQGNPRFQEGPQGDSSRFGPRPYDSRPPRGPQEEQRGYRTPRPPQPARPYGAPAHTPPRPPRPYGAPENASPRPPRPYGAPARTAPPASATGPAPPAFPPLWGSGPYAPQAPPPRPFRPSPPGGHLHGTAPLPLCAPASFVPAAPIEAARSLPRKTF